jgi:SAM-dependent methyltransferase
MRRIDRRGLRAPACVLDVELGAVGAGDQDVVALDRYDSMWCLSRFDGVPQEVSFWDVAEDTGISRRELRDRLRTGLGSGQPDPEPRDPKWTDPDMTVVICTRDRPAGLAAALRSLQRQTDTGFAVLVVDNSSDLSAAAVMAEFCHPAWGYTVEPRRGLARARNRALAAVRTELVAWMDDDEVADAGWVHALKEGFSHQAEPAAVCGMMLPAELEVEAQVRFEQYGGFNKGRGMTPEVLRMDASIASPLYPLPPFGPGGNMAFRTESLRSVGGFDPCLGAGTRSHTAEETRALSLLLLAGQAVLHWPTAITWHTHRREMAELRRQLYGCSAGLSAFYASMIRSKPTRVFDILRLLPYAVRDIRRSDKSMRLGQLPDDFPPSLLKAGRRGLIEGGLMYAYEVIADCFRPSVLKPQADSARMSAGPRPLSQNNEQTYQCLREKKVTSMVRLVPGKPTALPLNVSYRVSRIANVITGRWLDLGCADGGYTAELLRQGAAEVIGVDTEEERIANAIARRLPHTSFQVANGENLPFPDAHFDGVFMNEVFEHVADEKATLREVARVLAQDGKLVLISPNRWFPFEGHGMRTSFFTIENPVPLLPWLPQSLANRWMVARNYWPRQLVDQVKEAGLIVESRGFIWPVLEFYPWLPRYFRETYQAHIRFFDRTPGLRRFGVSTLVVARRDRKPDEAFSFTPRRQ